MHILGTKAKEIMRTWKVKFPGVSVGERRGQALGTPRSLRKTWKDVLSPPLREVDNAWLECSLVGGGELGQIEINC
jgi:hypothetical protein